jgi:hypothetical protein
MDVSDADYHRNGGSGTGFYVGIFEYDGRRMLGITFDDDERAVAVLDLDEAARGNIYMHPSPGKQNTGGNAWRGDHFMHIRAAFEEYTRVAYEKLAKGMYK